MTSNRPQRKVKVPPPPRMGKLEARYGAIITTLLEPFKELVRENVFPMLDLMTPLHPVRQDGVGEDTRRVFENIRIAYAQVFNPRDVTRAAREAASVIDTTNHRTFRKQTQTVLGVDPVFAEPWLQDEVETFVHENSSLIKSIPVEHLSDIEQMVFREGKRGASPADIKKKIQEQFKLSDTAAARIARDQVSKFNGRLSELRQQAAGLTHYTWRTSEDGRVRTFANSGGYSDHAKLNGKVFSWKKPPVTIQKGKRAGERNHPGQDINCRCYAEPFFGKPGKDSKKETGVTLEGHENVEQFEKILSGSTTLQKQLVNDLPTPNTIKQTGGHYHRGFGYNELAADPEKRGGVVVLHEYGHHLDYEINKKINGVGMFGISESDSEFKKAFLEDRKGLGFHRAKTKFDSMQAFFDKYYTHDTKVLKSGASYKIAKPKDEVGGGPLSDIIDAMTGGLFQDRHGAFGHGKRYYSRKGSKEKETFANLFSIRNKKPWEDVEKMFPNLAKRFDEILEMAAET